MKFIIAIFLFLNSGILFSQNFKLEKTREMFKEAKAISYGLTLLNPNPDTEEVTRLSAHCVFYNFNNDKYDFFFKQEGNDLFYENNVYSEINHSEKRYYQYEKKENQNIKSLRFIQYSPISLLEYNWKFINDTVLNGKQQSHYSFIESERKYGGNIVKIEYHIYVSDDYSIAQFERKSYVNDKLGQTVTYKFNDYHFSDKSPNQYTLPKNYSLKYFERIENLKPLLKNTKAPMFKGIDINGNAINSNNSKDETIVLFSSTNCGLSIMVAKLMSDKKFKLKKGYSLINVYGRDKIKNAKHIANKYSLNHTIIANRKDIEEKYGVAGYPMLYLIDKKGIITKVAEGLEPVMMFLKEINQFK